MANDAGRRGGGSDVGGVGGVGGSSDVDGGRGGASMAGSSRRSKQIVEETRNENPLIVHTALPRSSGGFLLTVVNSCQPFVVIQALSFR